MLGEELDNSIAEHAAYVSIAAGAADMEQAGSLVVKAVGKLFNAEIETYFESTHADDGISDETQAVWGSLRDLEGHVIGIMDGCGATAEQAKVLQVDAALAGVAMKWVEREGAKFTKRTDRCLEEETWAPVSDDQLMAGSAIDVVGMLIQARRGLALAPALVCGRPGTK